MSNLPNKTYIKSDILDKSVHLNSVKRPTLFADRNTRLENNCLTDVSNRNRFTEILARELPSKSNPQSQMNQLFKAPNLDSLQVKKAAVKSIRSPRSRVQTGRVKNELKTNQQVSKMSLIPRPSFINSRKSLHCSRSTQLNARKELIKKMVFLAECALKENKEVKKSTPVKPLAGLTPRKTPRSVNYFILPEFQKKIKKLEEIRSPIEDLMKKEIFAYSKKNATTPKRQNEMDSVPKPSTVDPNKVRVKLEEGIKTETDKISEGGTKLASILHQCKTYSEEVNAIHYKLRALDDSFEDKVKAIPDYRVYNEFLIYQSKKEEIYREMYAVEEELKNFVSSQTNVGQKLKAYLKKKREFIEKQMRLHRDFERAINAALENAEEVRGEENKAGKTKKEEPPRLRRSLRLSKIKKSKFEEKTPLTRKLKKLDNKSKGILKSGKV